MKTKHFFFALFILIILFSSCSVDKEISTEKNLKIVSFRIQLDNNQLPTPGQKVRIFAKVNKTKDVIFNWNIANEYYENAKDIIEWTIPLIAREYPKKVTAINKSNNETIVYEEKLIVGENYAELEVKDFKVKIKSYGQFISKECDEEKNMNIYIESKENIVTIKVEDEECSYEYVMEDGNFYEVDKEKSVFGFSNKKELIFNNVMPQIQNINKAQNFSLYSQMIKTFGTVTKLSETTYSFTKDTNNYSITIIVDTALNRIVEMKSVDGLLKNLNVMKFSYKLVNGHVELSKIENAEVSLIPTNTDAIYSVMEFDWSL